MSKEVPSSGPRPPLGLLFIAAPLAGKDCRVTIIDGETNPHWLQDLDKELDGSTICAGVSSMTGRQISGGLEFSRAVKDRFDIPVVWGGLHASMLPEQTIENDLVDIVVRGEGEESFLKIVTALRHGAGFRDIPAVWWKENGNIRSNPQGRFIDLNDVPSLPYHLIDCEQYIRIERSYLPGCRRTFELYTDRGCPHKCGFCYNININKRKWRAVAASRIIKDIEYLVDRFSLDGINFVGDNFFVNKKRVADICAGIIDRKINITWHADCRIDYFARYDDSFIALLKESGCRTLTFGVESGSQRMIDLMHKGMSFDELFEANEKLKKWQMGVNYHIMAGFPGETREDILQTYKMMLRLHDGYPAANFLGPSIYTPYPGTPLYHECIEMGFKPPEELRDWGKFEWDEKTCLPFIEHAYSKWLFKSADIASRVSIHVKSLRWAGWWFRLRLRMIIRFNMIGPCPEEKLFSLARSIVAFVKAVKKKAADLMVSPAASPDARRPTE